MLFQFLIRKLHIKFVIIKDNLLSSKSELTCIFYFTFPHFKLYLFTILMGFGRFTFSDFVPNRYADIFRSLSNSARSIKFVFTSPRIIVHSIYFKFAHDHLVN